MKNSITQQFQQYDLETKTASDFAVECKLPSGLFSKFLALTPQDEAPSKSKKERNSLSNHS